MTEPDARPRDHLDDLIDRVVHRKRPYVPPETPGELAQRADESYDDLRVTALLFREIARGLEEAAEGDESRLYWGLARAARAADRLAERIEADIADGEATVATMREIAQEVAADEAGGERTDAPPRPA